MKVNVVVLVSGGIPQGVNVFPAEQIKLTRASIRSFKQAADFNEESDAVGDFWDIEVQGREAS